MMGDGGIGMFMTFQRIEGSGLNQGGNLTQFDFYKDDCTAWKWVEIWRKGDKLGIVQNFIQKL